MNGAENSGKSSLILTNREALSLDGINDVISFDENAVYLQTESGKLLIEGTGLHITSLDVATGKMNIEGFVTSMSYNDRDGSKKTGLFSKGK